MLDLGSSSHAAEHIGQQVIAGMIRPKKNSCASCCRLVKIGTGADFFYYFFHFYDKTFRVEIAAQECGF